MKHLTVVLLLGLAAQSAWSAGNNYAAIERKEQQRLEQSRRDSARFNREYQQRWTNNGAQQGSRSSSSERPGRMLDVAEGPSKSHR